MRTDARRAFALFPDSPFQVRKIKQRRSVDKGIAKNSCARLILEDQFVPFDVPDALLSAAGFFRGAQLARRRVGNKHAALPACRKPLYMVAAVYIPDMYGSLFA